MDKVRDLLKNSYPYAAQTVSPLVNLVKVNPNLTEEIIELAIVIGINAAHWRIETDKKQTELIKEITRKDW